VGPATKGAKMKEYQIITKGQHGPNEIFFKKNGNPRYLHSSRYEGKTGFTFFKDQLKNDYILTPDGELEEI
jgi:hypothetical protein